MWMNPAKEMDQLKRQKFIEHEYCKWNKRSKMFKTLKVNYKFKQGQAEHLVYVLVLLILYIISLVCINSHYGCTETVYLNRVFFNLRKKPLRKAEATNGTNKDMFVVYFWFCLQWMYIVNGKFLTLHSNCFLVVWCMSICTETTNSLRIISLVSPWVVGIPFLRAV